MDQQQKLLFQQQQQQHFLLLQQQLQKQQQQAAAISRFPSNIDAHLRTPGLHNRPPLFPNPNPNSTSNPNLNPSPTLNPSTSSSGSQQQNQQQGGGLGAGGSSGLAQNTQSPLQQKGSAGMMMMKSLPVNQAELQMAYQGAWQVCHPDFRRPFTSLEDACERLLPYHVVADYEAEEDDRILDSDTTGQMLSRSQQWDHNIAAKVAEFTGTFEKQALAFNIITRKRAMGEFRSEERLMMEQALLQEEKRLLLDLKSEIDAREKAGREAQLRMAAMVQAEHARANSMRFGPPGSNLPVAHMGEQKHAGGAEEMMNGWGNSVQREEKEPLEDFLNDEENENGDAGHGDWQEFDLNSR